MTQRERRVVLPWSPGGRRRKRRNPGGVQGRCEQTTPSTANGAGRQQWSDTGSAAALSPTRVDCCRRRETAAGPPRESERRSEATPSSFFCPDARRNAGRRQKTTTTQRLQQTQRKRQKSEYPEISGV
ncbi:unnamed protein product [Ixodes pacificus]